MSRQDKKAQKYMPTPEDILRECSVIHPKNDANYGLEIIAVNKDGIVVRPVRIEGYLEECQRALENSNASLERSKEKLRSVRDRLSLDR